MLLGFFGRPKTGSSRFLRAAGTALTALLALVAPAATAQTVPDGFAPDVVGGVSAVAIMPGSGELVIGGNFTQVNGQTRTRLARLTHPGSLDLTYAPAANSTVSAIALQSDRKAIVGGSFTAINGTTRNRLARLNADGTLDTAFNPNPNGAVTALAVLPSGQILVAGNFTTLGGQTRNRIGRLNADGSLDTAFNPNASATIYAMRVQADGKILIGGNFLFVGPQTRARVARLNADGSVDVTFANPTVNNGSVLALDSQPDGAVVIGGNFTTVAGAAHSHLARIQNTGVVDPGFTASASDDVFALSVHPNGTIALGGLFAQVNGTARARLAQLSPSGALIPGFTAAANGDVNALALGEDGQWVVGGAFTTLNGAARRSAGRLSLDGALDAARAVATGPTPFGFPRLAVATADGGTVLVGLFSETNSAATKRIAKVKPDGTLDTAFAASIDFGTPYCMIALPDGRLLLGGYLTTVNGQAVSDLVMFQADGTLDAAFTAAIPASYQGVNAVVPLPSGKFLIAGLGNDARHHLIRLNANGTEDASFAVAADGQVHTAALQNDGSVLLGGEFTHLGPMPNPAAGTPRQHFARLTSSGTLDAAFAPVLPAAADVPRVLAVQDNGQILASTTGTTSFLRYSNAGVRDNTLATTYDSTLGSLIKQGDGRFYATGFYTVVNGGSRYVPTRLSPTAVLDSDFFPTSDGQLYVLSQMPDGKIWGGGQFTMYDGSTTPMIVRLNAPVPAIQSLTWNAATNTATFAQGGSSPAAVAFPQISISTDGVLYTALGPMTRAGNAWVRTGIVPPTATLFYLRVSAHAAGGYFNGSYSLLTATRQAYSATSIADRIFANGFEA